MFISSTYNSSTSVFAMDSPPRRRRRPRYTVPKKTNVKVMNLSHPPEEEADLPEAASGRSRDLSPVDQMREMLGDADEIIEDVIERIVNNVHTSAEHAGEMVHNASILVQTAACKSRQAVQNAATKSKHAMQSKVHQAEELAKDFYHILRDWKACHFQSLPNWMKDNEYLHFGHRPELPSFAECFKSIFRIHTETGNIWTHLLGSVAMLILTIIFYIKPLCTTCTLDINLSEKLIFLIFFVAAILCLSFSFIFHTVCCHSEWASALFSRLDYAGIAVLIVGSIIPWLYYGFYCEFYAKLCYMIGIGIFGVLTIIVCMWDRFNQPDFRVYRAIVFVGLALVGTIPLIHHMILNGVMMSFKLGAMNWMFIMGFLYILGAVLYAARIPERFYPGKCDIWFQSHQIFHLLVVAAAFVHYHGISEMAIQRLAHGAHCPVQTNVY